MRLSESNLSCATPLAFAPVPVAIQGSNSVEEYLVRARLGVFSGLFYALRAKHPPSAAHCLRVAMACSKWACSRQIPEADRDILEICALLHDIGKIGVPDSILQKPGRLDGQEQLMMDMASGTASELLRASGAELQIVQIIEQTRIAFDSQDHHLAARMVSIVDAFDSMTTEQVFRRALSRERAIEELCSHAGAQFDPNLVREYVELILKPRPELEAELVQRWLSLLDANTTPGFCVSGAPQSPSAVKNLVDTTFHHRLLESLNDAAIYLDITGQILAWNRAAERLSGRTAASLLFQSWTPECMGLIDDHGIALSLERCPTKIASKSNTQVNLEMRLVRQSGSPVKVNLSAIPVFSNNRELAGTIILVSDASAQAKLEERVQTLNAIATQDTLTKVANRAALNEKLAEFVEQHLQAGRRGSAIMCDIDFFKRINDNHGHHAGDDALVTFAGLLKQASRDDDFVARYGGEEFVILCEDCDNPAATLLAEEMRRAVERTPIPSLNGSTMTSSFGVTEIQEGDTKETFLARADRALLMAKESGRNRVVQLGAGMDESKFEAQAETTEEEKSSWLGWFRSSQGALVEKEYLASVPEEVAIQKLKDFIADHQAEILSATNSHVSIRIDGQKSEGVRRRGERAAIIMLDISVQGVKICSQGRSKSYLNRTRFKVSARPIKARDRRSAILAGQINQILHSFKAYLVAQEIDANLKATIIEPR
jgi:diguanylate cyclase (GGDEF)-like protein/PAS domain S-box-containing protein